MTTSNLYTLTALMIVVAPTAVADPLPLPVEPLVDEVFVIVGGLLYTVANYPICAANLPCFSVNDICVLDLPCIKVGESCRAGLPCPREAEWVFNCVEGKGCPRPHTVIWVDT